MIIGFDGSRAFVRNRTGTENYSFQLLKALSKIDRKNQYIVYLRPTYRDTIVEHSVGWPLNFEFKIIKWPRLWTQIGLAKQTFIDNLDVLFIPAHTIPLIHKSGLKTVVTVHDLGAEYLPKMHQLKQRLYLKWITNYQLKSANKLIAVSKATKNDLVKRGGINPGKVEVVYEGYDKELFKSVKGDVLINSLKPFNLVPGGYFLFVGTVQPRKNLERLIKAFYAVAVRPGAKKEDFTALQLVIVGNRGWLSDSIYKLPKKLRIENKVKFLGRVSDQDLPALYSGAIALTFPSLFEGFGLPILEAEACGCPVLTSNISSMPEVAGRGAIYVNPGSTEDIIKGMETVMIKDSHTPASQARLKIKDLGLKNVKRFSWEKCATQTLEVLRSV